MGERHEASKWTYQLPVVWDQHLMILLLLLDKKFLNHTIVSTASMINTALSLIVWPNTTRGSSRRK